MLRLSVPLVQMEGSLWPKSFPSDPELMVHPLAGVICHTIVLFSQIVPFTNRPEPFLERMFVTPTHTVSEGDTRISGRDRSETLIGCTIADDWKQGLVAVIVAENEFGKVPLLVPHEVRVNRWVTLAGAG